MTEGMQLSWWLIGAYLALMLGIGVWFRRRVRSVEDMAVAGRDSGVWLIAFSVAATWINGTTLIGISALGADFGLDAYWSGGSFMLGTIWIAYFIIPRLWETGVITIPELFGRCFGPRHRIVSLLLVILRDMGVTAGTIGALTLVTTAVLDISVAESLLLWLGVTSVYVFLGGMWAVMATDAIQFFIILAGSIAVLVAGLAAAGGFGELSAGLDPALIDIFGRAGVTQVLAWGGRWNDRHLCRHRQFRLGRRRRPGDGRSRGFPPARGGRRDRRRPSFTTAGGHRAPGARRREHRACRGLVRHHRAR